MRGNVLWAAVIGSLIAGPAALGAGPVLFPAAGAKDIPPDAQMHLTFSGKVTLGSGKIAIHSANDDAVIDSFAVAAPAGVAAPVGPPAAGGGAGGAAAGGAGARGNAGGRGRGGPGGGGAGVSFLPLPTRNHAIGGTNYVIYPVLITGNEAIITFDKPLAYGQSFYVTIDPGVFKVDGAEDAGVTDAKAWRFNTRAAPPMAGAKKIVVAADGTGDFCTVQGAIDFIPAGNNDPKTVYIHSGTYNEMVNFGGKNKLTFLGEDRKKTIIAYPDNNSFSTSPPTIPGGGLAAAGRGGGYKRGMFQAARGVSDTALANLTLHNTTPQGGSQAEAIILNGNAMARAIVTDVDMYSYQDTLQINGQAYISDCFIQGDVDFMWGTGPCFFEHCEAKAVRDKAYYTQIRNTAANHGYVFHECTFDGAPGITGNALARIDGGQFPASEVVLIDCGLTAAVGDAGWVITGTASPNIRDWEFNSHDADGKAVDVSKRLAASKQLKQPDDAETIKNYSDATWVLGNNWTPKLAPIIGGPPVLHSQENRMATLTVAAVAVPAPTYAWMKNGTAIPGANNATLEVEGVSAATVGGYTVVVTNSAGSATSDAAVMAGAGR